MGTFATPKSELAVNHIELVILSYKYLKVCLKLATTYIGQSRQTLRFEIMPRAIMLLPDEIIKNIYCKPGQIVELKVIYTMDCMVKRNIRIQFFKMRSCYCSPVMIAFALTTSNDTK